MKKYIIVCDVCGKEEGKNSRNWKLDKVFNRKRMDFCNSCHKNIEKQEKKIQKIKDKAEEDIEKLVNSLK